MKVIEAKTHQAKQDALHIRNLVFIEEQGVDPEIEHDQYDAEAIHIVGYLDQQPIAVARIRVLEGKGKIQRVAVLKSERSKGYGKKLMLEIEKILNRYNVNLFYLNSQVQVIHFYQALGYQISSEPFYEAGIEHVQMEKHV